MREFALEAAAFAASHFSKYLVMSPRIPTVGEGICAVGEHMVKCLGSTTEPALVGIGFHQTPPLQIIPGG